MTELKFFKISGKLFYPHIKEPETTGEYASGKYKLDLSVDDITARNLKTAGVQVKNKGNEKGNYVVIKAKKQPTVTLNGLELTDIPLIGNGSEGTITVGLYDNRESNVKAGKGGSKCLGLIAIDLTNLVEFSTPNLNDAMQE